MADHRRRVRHDVGLRHPALDAHVRRQRAELGEVDVVADGHHALGLFYLGERGVSRSSWKSDAVSGSRSRRRRRSATRRCAPRRPGRRKRWTSRGPRPATLGAQVSTGRSRRSACGPNSSSASAASVAQRGAGVGAPASRWMPTSSSGRSNCSAATAEANRYVSRTISSGRQSSVVASMPGQRGTGVEADEQLADHERRARAVAGEHLPPRRGATGRVAQATEGEPPRARPCGRPSDGAATRTSWPARS